VTPFVISYIVQIAIAVYAFTGMKVQPGMGQMFINLRKAAIGVAFLPCPGFAPFAQLVYVAIFKVREGASLRGQRQANAMLVPTFETGTPRAGSGRANAPANNPFDVTAAP
jgi:hypothetical protein